MTKSETERLVSSLIYAADCIRFYERVSILPSCNTCGDKKSCKYRPDWGDSVRINCPLWKKEGESCLT